jgi:hypothetical protein
MSLKARITNHQQSSQSTGKIGSRNESLENKTVTLIAYKEKSNQESNKIQKVSGRKDQIIYLVNLKDRKMRGETRT